MLPDDILNCTSSIALVVLIYPAIKLFLSCESPPPTSAIVLIKCLTNVVDDGLNKCKKPETQLSLAFPESSDKY